MQVSAKLDYGMRAMVELTARSEQNPDTWTKAEELARAQGIPVKFLEAILNEMRRGGLVVSRRGAEGGHRLGRPAARITVADVARSLEGPLAGVRGAPPEDALYPGSSTALREVWIAARAALRQVLESVTLADIVHRQLPAGVTELLELPGAWERR